MEELCSFKHEGETYYYRLDITLLVQLQHPDYDGPFLVDTSNPYCFLLPHFFDQFPKGAMTTAEDLVKFMVFNADSRFNNDHINEVCTFLQGHIKNFELDIALSLKDRLVVMLERYDLSKIKLFKVIGPRFLSEASDQTRVLFSSDEATPKEVKFIKRRGGLGYDNETIGSSYVIVSLPSLEGRAGPDVESYFFKVKNYTFSPEPIFLSLPKENPKFYFGMEIEVNTHVPVKELQEIVKYCDPVQEPFFYFKEDSSITGSMDYSYEIVTHPMSPRRMKKEWRILFNKLEKLCANKNGTIGDYFNWDGRLSNGIHIHISNTAFQRGGRPVSSYDNNHYRNRFLTAMNQWDSSFQNWMRKVTKRPGVGVESSYYPPHPEFDGKTLARRLKKGQIYSEHRSACHSTSRTTEVRVFYGLFQLDHINTCIEFTLAMLEFTAYASYKSFSRRFVEDFTQFVNKQQGYRTLKGVLKSCA